MLPTIAAASLRPEPKVIDDCDDDDACMGTAGFEGDMDAERGRCMDMDGGQGVDQTTTCSPCLELHDQQQ